MKNYKIIKQDPYCCVPACLQMIMDKHNIHYEEQGGIGYYLGLIVPKGYEELFSKVNVGSEPKAGYGTRLQDSNYSINHYFRLKNIPLEEEYFYIDNLEKAKKVIMDNLDNDIIVCFNRNALYDDGNNYGHVALIENIDDDMITMIEVEPDLDDYVKVSLKDLIKAITIHGKDKRAGFWIIRKKSL